VSSLTARPVGEGRPAREPGSFRDPDSRIFYANGGVYRALSARGLEGWEALEGSNLLRRALADGVLIETDRVDTAEVSLPDGAPDAALLRHQRVPFVSYPYEWPFEMLRDAALLQLRLLREALAESLILKDSTPYNVQFRGAGPVFIDVGSFERLPEGEPWAGYRQFCMLFLYPLLLQSYKGIRYQPLLRGSLEGVPPAQARAMMSRRDLLRRGVFTHVHLHAKLEERYGRRGREVKGDIKRSGFRKELIVANVARLEKLVSRLSPGGGASVWTGYGDVNSYSDEDARRKERFVAEAAAAVQPRLVWDLGCNTGRYTRVAAEHASYALAVDADPAVVDELYRNLRAERSTRILPLVMNVADPSPALGWRGLERRPLEERGRPDLVLCLAIVHHVVISGNVPVTELLDWLAGLGGALVIEFPTREDPMVQQLLGGRRGDAAPDYRLDWFEACLAERFILEAREELGSGTRVLFRVRPRG
jgi:SAM-dependent methyltransferase